MSELRLNQLTGRWVTIVPRRAQRPNDFAPRSTVMDGPEDRPCPFCPGNEEATPPALETIDNTGAWTIRVVPNLYPAFTGDDGFAVHNEGPVHVNAEGTGLHEVFVYTPDHFSISATSTTVQPNNSWTRCVDASSPMRICHISATPRPSSITVVKLEPRSPIRTAS